MNITSWFEFDPHQLDELVRSTVTPVRTWRTAVLYGAASTEDRLYMQSKPQSDWSVHDVLAGLEALGVTAQWLDPTADDFHDRVGGFDAAFLNVHGDFGEDGNLQGTLAYLGVPYTGSGVATSAIGADKRLTKLVLAGSCVTVPAHQRLTPADPVDAHPGCPVMLKAVNGGSSVGTVLITEPADFEPTLRQLWEDGFHDVLSEPFITGTAVTVPAIRMGGQAVMLPPIACLSDREYYDEYSKLHGEQAGSVHYQALLDPDDQRLGTLHEATREVLATIGFEGAIRADFILTEDGDPVLLEVNTIPGVQHGSNLVLSAEAAGIAYPDLLGVILASARHGRKLAPWTSAANQQAQDDVRAGTLPATTA